MEEESEFFKGFSMLGIDEDGKIHKDKIKEGIKMMQGALYDEETANSIIDYMKPDNDGWVTAEGFGKLISVMEESPDSLAAILGVLKKFPELFKGLTDWKNVMKSTVHDSKFSEEDVEQYISEAREQFVSVLSQQVQKQPPEDEKMVKDLSAAVKNLLYKNLRRLDEVKLSGGASLNGNT